MITIGKLLLGKFPWVTAAKSLFVSNTLARYAAIFGSALLLIFIARNRMRASWKNDIQVESMREKLDDLQTVRRIEHEVWSHDNETLHRELSRRVPRP